MSVDLEQEAKEAIHRAEDRLRERTPERVSLRIAITGWLVSSFFAFILGHLTR